MRTLKMAIPLIFFSQQSIVNEEQFQSPQNFFYGIPCRPFTRTRPGSEPSASHMSTGPIKLVL